MLAGLSASMSTRENEISPTNRCSQSPARGSTNSSSVRAFFSWHACFTARRARPDVITIHLLETRPDLRDNVTIPDVLLQAHSAPLQIVFYDAEAFPAEYKGSALVTLHGSWNRGQRTGYKVVGVAVAKDGSLLVTEDGNGTIRRVSRHAQVK
jgi:glucose/arabinose dehydrogenase